MSSLAGLWRSPIGRIPWPVDPKPVALAGPDAGDVAVMDVSGPLGQPHPLLVAVVVEQAEIDGRGRLGETATLMPVPSNLTPNGWGAPNVGDVVTGGSPVWSLR